MLHESPELVHRFYQDISKLGRPEQNAIMGVTTTMSVSFLLHLFFTFFGAFCFIFLDVFLFFAFGVLACNSKMPRTVRSLLAFIAIFFYF